MSDRRQYNSFYFYFYLATWELDDDEMKKINTSRHSERRATAEKPSLQNPIIKVIGIKQWHLHGNLIGPSTFLSRTNSRLSVLPPLLCSLNGRSWWPFVGGFRCRRRRRVQLGKLILTRGLWRVRQITVVVVGSNLHAAQIPATKIKWNIYLVFLSSWCEWSWLWEKLLARIKMKITQKNTGEARGTRAGVGWARNSEAWPSSSAAIGSSSSIESDWFHSSEGNGEATRAFALARWAALLATGSMIRPSMPVMFLLGLFEVPAADLGRSGICLKNVNTK